MIRVLIITIILLVQNAFLFSQEKVPDKDINKLIVISGRIVDGDTLPHVDLREVVIMPAWKFTSEREFLRYSRLIHNVKVTLPYARLASSKLLEISLELEKIQDEKARKKYLKEAEKKLFDEFEDPLKKLTFSQGRLLIKLIDRETGDTSYNLIRQYKGKMSAFFWQGIARIFGANLKDNYDPDTEDKMIEHIITLMNNGRL